MTHTKIDIFSGFLGAGKTTLLKKMIAEAYTREKLVLIENEFGEIGIDGSFLQEAGVKINEMNSGCICCSLVGDFEKALKQVVEEYSPNRILIEPSGVGKLSEVMNAVKKVAKTLPVVLNSTVVVADVRKVVLHMKNFGEFYNDQIQNARCIILSRVETAPAAKIALATAMLTGKNHKANLITTAWGELDGKQILNAMEIEDSLATAMSNLEQEMHSHESGCSCGGEHGGDCGCGHDHTEHEHGCGGCGGHGEHVRGQGECKHGHSEEERKRDGSCGGCGGHDHAHGSDCAHGHDEHEHNHENACASCGGCGGNEHEQSSDCSCGHDHDEHEHSHEGGCSCGHDHHHADEVFATWGTQSATKISKEALQTALEALNSGEYGMILRAKGVVDTGNGWCEFDFVPDEINIRERTPDVTGKIVVIGAGIDSEKIANLFQK